MKFRDSLRSLYEWIFSWQIVIRVCASAACGCSQDGSVQWRKGGTTEDYFIRKRRLTKFWALQHLRGYIYSHVTIREIDEEHKIIQAEIDD